MADARTAHSDTPLDNVESPGLSNPTLPYSYVGAQRKSHGFGKIDLVETGGVTELGLESNFGQVTASER
jgi:hypothetical protein